MKLAILVLLSLLTNMPIFAKETKEQVFWRWFVANEDRLFQFEKDQESTFDQLDNAMAKVHEDLTFEFGPVRTDGTREFVISAGGLKAVFPSVESLHRAAPELKRWKFIKYRQRRTPINDIEYGGVEVKAKEVHYAVFKDEAPGKIGIMLYLDGYAKGEKEGVLGQIGYLFLDEALGEFDVGTKVGTIVFFGRDSKYFERRRPLSELQTDFDNWKKGQKVNP